MKNKKEINAKIISMRLGENKAGLGRIFRTIRNYKELEGVADIPLYKRIIRILREIGCKGKNNWAVGNREIVRHFSNIDKEDYDLSEKRQILEDLKKTGL